MKGLRKVEGNIIEENNGSERCSPENGRIGFRIKTSTVNF